MSMDQIPEEVLQLLLEGNTYKDVSDILQRRYSHVQRGLSERSVWRFASKAGLKLKKKAFIEKEVRSAVEEVELVQTRDMHLTYSPKLMPLVCQLLV